MVIVSAREEAQKAQETESLPLLFYGNSYHHPDIYQSVRGNTSLPMLLAHLIRNQSP